MLRFSLFVLAIGLELASSFAPAASPLALRRAAAVPAVSMAYNPTPSKAKPKKKKVKGPKEKTVAPAAASSVLAPEQTFWEGPPSMTETLIPGLSLFTVVGVIPFSASIARQAWTRYKLTSRRIEVASGFQGKDVVQVIWREIADVKWLRRYGGAAGDLVFSLGDGSKLEVRSVPDFDRNLAFIMSMVDDDARDSSGYPDGPARDYIEKVASGEFEKPELPPYDPAAASA